MQKLIRLFRSCAKVYISIRFDFAGVLVVVFCFYIHGHAIALWSNKISTFLQIASKAASNKFTGTF